VPQPEHLTPQEEQVRRLLADARHTEPLPDEVAARLDAVLADLRHEDPAAPPSVPATRRPTDLAAARRRRNVRSWLIAAAAVVVLGVGIDRVSQMDGAGDDASSSSADTSSELAERPQDGGSAPSAAQEGPSPTSSELGALGKWPVRLDSERFGTQVTRLQGGDRARMTNGATSALRDWREYAAGLDADAATCPARGWGRGSVVPVRYDGRPGLLVFRKVRGDTQVVDLFLCGADELERSITLPAP
jgi:hypothetical protein